MDRITINHRNKKNIANHLGIEDMYYTDDTYRVICAICSNHGLSTGDRIYFDRKVCEHITFSDSRVITYIDKDSFTFEAFPDISATASSVVNKRDKLYYINPEGERKEMSYLKFDLDYGYQHNFVRDRHEVDEKGGIRDVIGDMYYEYTDSTYTEYYRRCPDDYVLCGDLLYKSVYAPFFPELNTTRYILNENTQLNIMDKGIKYYDVNLGGCAFGTGEGEKCTIVNDNVGYTNGIIIVPSLSDGYDNRNCFYWCYGDEDIKTLNYLLSEYDDNGRLSFTFEDYRFYENEYKWVEIGNDDNVRGDSSWSNTGKVDDGFISKRVTGVKLFDDTVVTAYNEAYTITLPLARNNEYDLLKQENITNVFLEDEKEKAINDIIDYEKKVFTPCFYNGSINDNDIDSLDDNKFEEVSKLVFNLHFRKRDRVESEDYDGYYDYGEFDLNENLDWNICEYDYGENVNGTLSQAKKQYYHDDESDLLGDIGFIDEDVYYQKNKLKNTFIRVMFYDSMNRSTQKLIAYNTIFVDTSKLYNKYVNCVNDKNYSVNGQYVYNNTDDRDKRLGIDFECASKYNTEVSSDGFYFYAHKTIVDGSTPTPLYMKVEFNHAKYGKTIGMTMPVNEKYEPLTMDDNTFPMAYNTNSGVNLKQALRDHYIKVYAKYCPSKNMYIWFLPRNGVKENVVFNLYEPKLVNLKNMNI